MLVILKKDYGQLGNRLHTYANLLAWCMEHNCSLVNLSFKEHSNKFSKYERSWNDQFWRKYSITKFFVRCHPINWFLNKLSLSDKWLDKLEKLIKVIDRNDDTTLQEKELNKELSTKKAVLIIRAWDIRCPIALSKQNIQIKSIFTPKYEISKFIEKYINKLPKYTYLVGIHARRGDYSDWENGKYFFSWEKYNEWLLELESNLITMGHRPFFLICSNEKPPANIFAKRNISISKFDEIIDLYLLANCNLVLGPPSSFSSWAVFYGNNKRVCVLDENQTLKVNIP